MTTRYAAAAILAVAVLLQPAAAQSLADLLQKGIYTQETVGDLDGAITIYRQIVSSGSDSRVYAAQAQYRLGLCLLKKGDQAEATKAFEKLVQDYPEQTDLVAKAREYIPAEMKLLPVPWTDNELMELSMKVSGSMDFGTMITTVEPSPANPQNSIFQRRTYAGVMNQWSRVEVDREYPSGEPRYGPARTCG